MSVHPPVSTSGHSGTRDVIVARQRWTGGRRRPVETRRVGPLDHRRLRRPVLAARGSVSACATTNEGPTRSLVRQLFSCRRCPNPIPFGVWGNAAGAGTPPKPGPSWPAGSLPALPPKVANRIPCAVPISTERHGRCAGASLHEARNRQRRRTLDRTHDHQTEHLLATKDRIPLLVQSLDRGFINSERVARVQHRSPGKMGRRGEHGTGTGYTGSVPPGRRSSSWKAS